jgi:hypothetical protein
MRGVGERLVATEIDLGERSAISDSSEANSEIPCGHSRWRGWSNRHDLRKRRPKADHLTVLTPTALLIRERRGPQKRYAGSRLECW